MPRTLCTRHSKLTLCSALAHSEREALTTSRRYEIVVDDEPVGSGSAAWVTPVVLFTGLLLTVLLSRAGLRFFFLPIILPFGFGGGRLLRQLLPSRRVLRYEDGKLWLASVGVFRSSVDAIADVAAGAFVMLGSSGLWLEGQEDACLRVTSDDGVVSVPVRGGEKARMLRRELEELFDATSVPLLERTALLQGVVSAEPFEEGEQLAWSADGRMGGLLGRRSTTELRVTPDAWALRVRSGTRVLVSTGGPGKLAARVAELVRESPLGASVVQDTVVLELVAEGEIVGQIGAELSEPELNWIAARIERAAT
jgi:hypothetical protein